MAGFSLARSSRRLSLLRSMGHWATYRKRGGGGAYPRLCPHVSATPVTSCSEIGANVDCIYDDPPDLPDGWFVLGYQSTTALGPWVLRDSNPKGSGPYETLVPVADGLFIMTIGSELADGTGCLGDATVSQAS